jgi:hypothetical protein
MVEYNSSNISEYLPWDESASCHPSRKYPLYLLEKMANVAKNSKLQSRAEADIMAMKSKDGPTFIFMKGTDTMACSSSLTGSEVSSEATAESTECSSSLWSYAESKPPKIIKVSNPLERTSLPYAQLCFDPETKALVTLMEINLAGNGRHSKRLRIIDPQEENGAPVLPTTLQMISSSNSGTASTVSTRSNGPGDEILKYDEPIVLSSYSEEVWLEETDLGLYLLHECEDPWEAHGRGGCKQTLKNLFIASRLLIVFKKRDSQWEPSRESLTRIEYAMLGEA